MSERIGLAIVVGLSLVSTALAFWGLVTGRI